MNEKSINVAELAQVANDFGELVSAVMPSLVELFKSTGKDHQAAIEAMKVANAVARTNVDDALKAKYGR